MKKKWIIGTKDSFKKDINENITSEINLTDYGLLSEGTIPNSTMTMLELWGNITSPTTNTINAIFMLSDTKGWAVGDNGTILKYDGNQWILESSPTSNNLRSIYMLSETSGWAVGDYGDDGQSIYRYNGTNWSPFLSPDIFNKFGIFMVSETDGWIVATGGRILRYNGTSWSVFASPTTAYLRSVFMTSNGTDGWIVGATGEVLRWNNVQWTYVSIGTSKHLYSVCMVSANYGWAVGEASGAYDGGIYKWDGVTWSESNNPIQLTACYYSVYAKSENEAWAVNHNGGIIKWDGVKWRLSPSSYQIGTTYSLQAIAMSSSTKGFIVGTGGKIAKPIKGSWISKQKGFVDYEWIKLNLEQTRQINQIKLSSANLKDFKFQLSLDDITYTDIITVTNNIDSVKWIDFTKLNLNYLKLIITAVQSNDNYVQVLALELSDNESNLNAQLLEHNPQSQEENIPSGAIVTTISGLPRKMMSTIPTKTISVSGENIKQTMKEFLEKLQKVNTNLILVISTLYGDEKIYEVIPGNFRAIRRKTIPFETEPSYSYQYELQVVKQWA